jgi:putative peptidoglycan lipid II flippase
MAPAIFGVSVTPVNLLVDTLVASFLTTGSVSWLYYSDRLVEFPLGVFGVAMGTAILPHLAKSHARDDAAGFSDALDWGLRWVLLIGLPATVGLMALAQPLMSTLFQYDEFGSRDVEMAGRSLMTYSSGLIGFIAVKILASGFSARHDLQTPVRHAVYSVIANFVLGLVLVVPLARFGWGHAALALATALAALLNAGLLLRGLLHEGIIRPQPGWAVYLARLVVANLVMAGLLAYFTADLPWPSWTATQRIVQLTVWIAVGGAAYFACLWLSGMRPAQFRLETL